MNTAQLLELLENKRLVGIKVGNNCLEMLYDGGIKLVASKYSSPFGGRDAGEPFALMVGTGSYFEVILEMKDGEKIKVR